MFENSPILKTITLFILPYIFLYSLYIQVNGEVSPGGGFQAGVIFAAGLIGFDLIYGQEKVQRYFSIKTLIVIAALGVLIYAATGAFSWARDDNYLNYYSLADDKITAQKLGIFLVEIGVGLTVASVMSIIYFLFNQDNG